MYLLDTNACIRFLRDANSAVARRLATVDIQEVAVCAVVKAELYYGARRSADPEHSSHIVRAFLAGLTSWPFDDDAAEVYGHLRADLAREGMPIGPNDLMISSIAVAHQATLVTHNMREFARVPGLKSVDWET